MAVDEDVEITPLPRRRGRKRDPKRDGAILDAALVVLAEDGFEGMTMDAVAARAKAGKATVYRRWASKSELVLDAIGRLRTDVTSEQLPDTGSFRGDLMAFVNPELAAEQEQKLRVASGMSSLMQQDPSIARAVIAALMEPWVELNRLLMTRAVERGQLPSGTDVALLSQVIPQMASYRALVMHEPVDPDAMAALIDGVLLPAIRGAVMS